jgi:hypothetical protein
MSMMTPREGPVSGVVHSVADLAGDVLEILELQVRLAQKDGTDALRIGLAPLVALAFGMSMMVAALPIIAFALATVIQTRLGLSEWVAQLGIGATMIVVALLMSFFAIRMLISAASTFGRSASEFSKNTSWLKSVARRDRG